MARLLISATRKSSGKTTFTLGVLVALSRRGLAVQPFKKGPDYIDPLWLGAAAGRDCLNLDFNTMEADEILGLFGRYGAGASLSLVEGTKGLYDGIDPEGSDSNAALARLLSAPVILVIDVEGMTRGVAPLINGYRSFDAGVEFAGVVLNNYSGSRHLGKLRAAVETYTDLRVAGAIPRCEDVRITERHLGLTTRSETGGSDGMLDRLGRLVADCVDLDPLLDRAREAPALEFPEQSGEPAPAGSGLRIGIARDSAFCFYYPDDLDEMRRQGAELFFFDTLSDSRLPEVDALMIGGGFPETHAFALERNGELRAAIRRFIASGGPVYAECGGLMYLTRALTWQGRRHAMVGAIPAEVAMEERPVGRGYVVLERTGRHPWMTGGTFRAHEFHYSRIVGLADAFSFGLRVRRGHGIDGTHDGLVMGNLFATYAHQRHTRQNPWVTSFLGSVARLVDGSEMVEPAGGQTA